MRDQTEIQWTETNITIPIFFSTFDKHEVGFISESSFKQIMSGKDDVRETDIAEMLEEYYRFAPYF